jgi:hypothetical protein
MHHITLADWIDFFFGNPIGWFFLLVLSMLGNYLVLNFLADAYLRRNRLAPLDWSADDRGQRLLWRLLTLWDAPGMGVALRLSLWLNRILIAAFVLCLLSVPVSLFLNH